MTVSEIIKNGGATIDRNGNAVNLKSGFQVSVRDLGVCFADELTEQMINDVVTYGVKGRRGYYCGVWVENGRAYVDISRRIASKKNALQVGKESNQISIFDWKNNTCVYCK